MRHTAASAPYPVPKAGDTYLVDPATNARKHIVRLLREGTGMNARTFTVVNEDRNLAWVRYAEPQTGFVDAIHHVDCGGWYGEPCLYARLREPNQTLMTACDVIPEEIAEFSRKYPEEAA